MEIDQKRGFTQQAPFANDLNGEKLLVSFRFVYFYLLYMVNESKQKTYQLENALK